MKLNFLLTIISLVFTKLVNSLIEGEIIAHDPGANLVRDAETDRKEIRAKQTNSKFQALTSSHSSNFKEYLDLKGKAMIRDPSEKLEEEANTSKTGPRRTRKASKQQNGPHQSQYINVNQRESDSPSKQTQNIFYSHRSANIHIMDYQEVFRGVDMKNLAKYVRVSARMRIQQQQKDKASAKNKQTSSHEDDFEQLGSGSLDREQLFKKWSETLVLKWQRDDLDLELMDLISTYLRLNKRSQHLGITETLKKRDFYTLKHAWMNSPDGLSRVEAAIQEELGTLEFLRRMNAFRFLLRRFTIASNWIQIINTTPVDPKFDIHLFGREFGLVRDRALIRNAPSVFRLSNRLDVSILNSPSHRDRAKKILEEICGPHEGQRRFQFRLYLLGRMDPDKSIGNIFYGSLFDKSHQYGLNLATIVKVKDALRLTASAWADRNPEHMNIDQSYSLLISIMADENAIFPWSESPERAWLQKTYGKIYFDQLTTVCLANTKYARNVPKSIEALQKIVGNKFKIDAGYMIGSELLWLDFGFNPKEVLLTLRNSKNSQDLERFRMRLAKLSDEERKALQQWHSFVKDCFQSLKKRRLNAQINSQNSYFSRFGRALSETREITSACIHQIKLLWS